MEGKSYRLHARARQTASTKDSAKAWSFIDADLLRADTLFRRLWTCRAVSLGRGRVHSSLENAARFPQLHSPAADSLVSEGRSPDTSSTRLADFQPFPSGRFSLFGDKGGSPECHDSTVTACVLFLH